MKLFWQTIIFEKSPGIYLTPTDRKSENAKAYDTSTCRKNTSRKITQNLSLKKHCGSVKQTYGT